MKPLSESERTDTPEGEYKKSWAEAVIECVSDSSERERLIRMYDYDELVKACLALGTLALSAKYESANNKELESQRGNLAMLCRGLIHKLRLKEPNSDLAKRGMAYLTSKGLQGSPLREEEAQGQMWIPVEERLPERAGYYLAAFEDGCVADDEYYGPPSNQWWRETNANHGKVKHWMPLPAAPGAAK